MEPRARPRRLFLPGYGQNRWGIGIWLGLVLMALAGGLIAVGDLGQALLVAGVGLMSSIVSGVMAAARSDPAADRARGRVPILDIAFAILAGFAILLLLRLID